MAYDETTADRVRKLLAGRRDVVEKKMMGSLCFMVKGAMCFSVSGQGGLLVRVGTGAQERVLREPHVKPMEMGRRIMTGFVRVDPDGYRSGPALKKWVERGVAFVLTRPAASPHGTKQRSAAKQTRKTSAGKNRVGDYLQAR
jgi:TfoX/Sxy family transcriptional regulator of competence genes